MYYDRSMLDGLDELHTEIYDSAITRISEARRIVMKFGTDAVSSVFNGYGASLAKDIKDEMDEGKELLIVSSGAIGQGKSLATIEEPDPVIERSVYASLGQPLLMDRWRHLLAQQGINGSQVLYENENLTGESTHKDYIKAGLESMLRNGIVPIVNENDAVTSEEIRSSGRAKTFGDNDNLARLVCELVDADLLIFFTGAGGVYDDIDDKDSLYKAIFAQDEDFYKKFDGSASANGKGGLRSKLETSEQLAASGIPVVISSPAREHPLNCSLYDPDGHTVVVPYFNDP